MSLSDICRELYEELGNRSDAEEEFFRRFAEPPPALVQECVRVAVHYTLRHTEHKLREAFWHKESKPRHNRDNTAGLFLKAADNLLRYPLVCGKLLGEARRPDLLEELRFYKQQVRGMVARIEWITKIVELIPDDSTKVSKLLTHEQLAALLARA